jgi:hypothetical protein
MPRPAQALGNKAKAAVDGASDLAASNQNRLKAVAQAVFEKDTERALLLLRDVTDDNGKILRILDLLLVNKVDEAVAILEIK